LSWPNPEEATGEGGANVKIYNLNYTVYGEYPSITVASKSLNCNEKTIRKALKTEKKLLKKR
jgi:NUMOD1 domain